MKKFVAVLGVVAAIVTILGFLLQIWPSPNPKINVLVEDRAIGILVIRAVTDEGSPIANGQVSIRPQKGSSYDISTNTNSRGELEIRAESLIGTDGPEEWRPDSRFITEAGAIPIYVSVSKNGYEPGEIVASIDVR